MTRWLKSLNQYDAGALILLLTPVVMYIALFVVYVIYRVMR